MLLRYSKFMGKALTSLNSSGVARKILCVSKFIWPIGLIINLRSTTRFKSYIIFQLLRASIFIQLGLLITNLTNFSNRLIALKLIILISGLFFAVRAKRLSKLGALLLLGTNALLLLVLFI
jgi:hypothetical protein